LEIVIDNRRKFRWWKGNPLLAARHCDSAIDVDVCLRCSFKSNNAMYRPIRTTSSSVVIANPIRSIINYTRQLLTRWRFDNTGSIESVELTQPRQCPGSPYRRPYYYRPWHSSNRQQREDIQPWAIEQSPRLFHWSQWKI